MQVRLYKGFLYSVDAHILNDWHEVPSEDLQTGSELIGDDILGDVSIESAILDLPR